jgi:hypothetical protein
MSYSPPFRLNGHVGALAQQDSASVCRSAKLMETLRASPTLRGCFYLLTSLQHEPRIIMQEGLYKSLAYTSDFSYEDFRQAIHPDYRENFELLTMSSHQLLRHNANRFGPFTHTLRFTLPLRHYNGEYFNFARLSTAISLDENGEVLEYLDQYSLSGVYTEHNPPAIEPFWLHHGERKLSWEREFITMIKDELFAPLTIREYEILELYATSTDALTCRHISQMLGIASDTVYVHHKAILRKLKTIFKMSFQTTRQAAEYCYKRGLV